MRRHSPENYSPPRRGYGGRERSPPRRGYGGSSRRRDRNHGSLLVRNIHLDCRLDELRIQIEGFGLVRDVYLPREYYTGISGPVGFCRCSISVVVAADSRKRPKEMRHWSGAREPSGYGGRRAYHGCSGSCSPSPRHQSGFRNREHSRSYSPPPRCRRDYSASPRWGPVDDHSGSPSTPLVKQPGKKGSSPWPSCNNGYNLNGKEWDSNRGHSLVRAYRSPSGYRSRSANSDASPVHSP